MEQKSLAGHPTGTYGSDFLYRTVVYSRYIKVAKGKSRLKSFIAIQTLSQVIGSICMLLSVTAGKKLDKAVIISTSTRFMALLIGEIGRRKSLGSMLRVYIILSSIVASFSLVHFSTNHSTAVIQGDYDPWTAWAYKPRTISLLLIGTCLLIWASGSLDPESTASHDIVTSVKRCVGDDCGLLSLFFASSSFYNRDDARQFMKFLHPDLGIELPERSYGADCRIYVPDNPKNRFINVYDTLFDEFVLAHIFGWWGKAIMIRNQPLLWVLSIGFELMELTFRHMLPNFNECWWDSIILDILICNWFGIWAGMHTVRYFDGKTYEWVGISRQPNILGKVKRTLCQFTPARWDKDEWHPLLGPWRFIQVLTLCVIFMTVELNTFFLKFCLWIPPRNPIITYRLVLWWLIAIPTIREYNTYLQDRKPVKKVGAFCWLALAICIVELLICIKFGHGLFPDPMPTWLVVFWSSVGAALAIFLLLWSRQIHRTLQRKRR